MARGSLSKTYNASAAGKKVSLGPNHSETVRFKPQQHQQGKKQLYGDVTVTVLEAEKLAVPHGVESLRPCVQVAFGDETVESGIAVGSYLHMWNNATFKFRVRNSGTVTCRVVHRPHSTSVKKEDDLPIGTATILLEPRNECGQKWIRLEAESDGDDEEEVEEGKGSLKVRWDFEALPLPPEGAVDLASQTLPNTSDIGLISKGGGGEEGEGIHGHLRLEIVRAKGLVPPPDWLTFSPFVVLKYHGEAVATKVQKNTTNPFYNHRTEFSVRENAPLVFQVLDANDGVSSTGDPRFYGTVGWAFDPAVTIKTTVVTLTIQENLDDLEPNEDLGELHVRVTYKAVPKPGNDTSGTGAGMIDEGSGLVSLGYTPEIDGSVSIVPENCQYVWYDVSGDGKFRMVLEQRVVEAYIRAVAPGRPRADRHEAVPMSLDTVVSKEWKCTRVNHVTDMVRLCAQRIARKEPLPVPQDDLPALRVRLAEQAAMRMTLVASSPAAKEALKRLWEVFHTGTDGSGEEDTFDEIHHRALLCSYLTTFVPGITMPLAKQFADLEWTNGGSSGKGPDGKVMLKEERFQTQVAVFASMWCDTLTEYELLQFLAVAASPVVIEARKLSMKWRKRKSVKHVKTIVRVGFKKPEHLDDLGHRIRSKEPSPPSTVQEQPRKRPSRHISTGEPVALVQEQHTKHHTQREVDDFADFTFKSVDLDSTTRSAGGGSRGGRRRSTRKLSSAKRKKKPPFEAAEDRVKKAFEMEDLEWSVVDNYVKEMYGGFTDARATDVLNMGHSELDLLIQRIMSSQFTTKHHKIRSDLVTAALAYFSDLKELMRPPPTAAPASEPPKTIGANVSEDVLRCVLAFSSVPVLKKVLLAGRKVKQVAEAVLQQRLADEYPLPPPQELPAALSAVFTEDHCTTLRNQVGLGRLKAPPRLGQALGEIVSTVLGIETGGYWAKFRESICRKGSYEMFSGFDLASVSSDVFEKCRKFKWDNDNGLDRQGRRLQQEMAGVAWTTMTETSVTRLMTPEMTALYKWVKLLLMSYARYAGTDPYSMQTYGWKEPAKYDLYWD